MPRKPTLKNPTQTKQTHLEDSGDPLLIKGAVTEGSDGHLLGQAVDVVGGLDVVHVLDDVLIRVRKAHSGQHTKSSGGGGGEAGAN